MDIETSRKPSATPSLGSSASDLSSIDLSVEAQVGLVEAARSSSPIVGLTHNFYRYPARFSPLLVGSVIEALSDPGDLILDPFMGGGTTLVEAAARGRHAVGSDISTLASFVARAKTAVLDDATGQSVREWLKRVPGEINMRASEPEFQFWADAGYFKHLGSAHRWRVRKALAQCVESAERIGSPEAESFARCVILRTAQWALDGRKIFPSLLQFRKRLQTFGEEMLISSKAFTQLMTERGGSVTSLNRSVVGLENDDLFRRRNAPRLILTSPPYPGVHVLYHRWQVSGGKETGTPFFIANALDGSGSSYYTMGDRKRPGLATYFEQLREGLASLVHLSDDRTTFVQVVAFSQPEWQLPAYLDAAAGVGLAELFLPILQDEADGRLWRQVPNRKWYAQQRSESPGSQEVVLFHRLT